MTVTEHPKESQWCEECGVDAKYDPWQKKRTLPQIGQTWACENCGREVYVYTIQDRGDHKRVWREVTDHMLVNLQFWSVCGEWPDHETEDLVKQGLDRMAAIDYHVVEREGLTQSEWADMTDRKQPTVSESVSKARKKLAE